MAYPAYVNVGQPMRAPHYDETADSVGSWMLALFLTGLPLIGFIYILVVAFGGSASLSRRNWARAALIWQLISVVAAILFVALGGFALFMGSQSASSS